jgi:hypothetical protein
MADRAAAVPEQGRPFACRDGWHRPAFKEGRTQTRDSLPIEGGGRLCASTGNEDRSFAGIFCRWELSWQASTVVARGRACPRVPAHPQMYPSRTRETSTRRLSRQQRALFAGLYRSPLTDSNRRPPPYHVLLAATGRNPRQRFSLVFAVFGAVAFAAVCHRLQPRGSIKAPSAAGECRRLSSTNHLRTRRCRRSGRLLGSQPSRWWSRRLGGACRTSPGRP